MLAVIELVDLSIAIGRQVIMAAKHFWDYASDLFVVVTIFKGDGALSMQRVNSSTLRAASACALPSFPLSDCVFAARAILH